MQTTPSAEVAIFNSVLLCKLNIVKDTFTSSLKFEGNTLIIEIKIGGMYLPIKPATNKSRTHD